MPKPPLKNLTRADAEGAAANGLGRFGANPATMAVAKCCAAAAVFERGSIAGATDVPREPAQRHDNRGGDQAPDREEERGLVRERRDVGETLRRHWETGMDGHGQTPPQEVKDIPSVERRRASVNSAERRGAAQCLRKVSRAVAPGSCFWNYGDYGDGGDAMRIPQFNISGKRDRQKNSSRSPIQC
jgi:hypothetical protein